MPTSPSTPSLQWKKKVTASRVRNKSHRRIEYSNAFRTRHPLSRTSRLVPPRVVRPRWKNEGRTLTGDYSRPTNGAVRCGSETLSSEPTQVQGNWL
ncbi:hypothetical protein EV363DRAFT_1259816 [Boletus edulis]|nr:hypothetical protein EV363DRAFT_1259816 [Boletus edulis]